MVAVDLPSGVSSDTGDLPWPAVPASLTVTFAAPKYGHVLPPACDRVGELLVADIGIPREALDKQEPEALPAGGGGRAAGLRRAGAGSHKGTYGHLLVVAGSVGKTGAAVLAATARAARGRGPGDGGDARARAGPWWRRGGRS